LERSFRCGTRIAHLQDVSSNNLSRKELIMVVDDDPSMCRFLEAFLAERGHAAITIGSAEEAVARYQEERPAAVILDVVMPGTMDGLDALAAFKRIDRNVPVIVVSGQGRTANVVQAMKLGAGTSSASHSTGAISRSRSHTRCASTGSRATCRRCASNFHHSPGRTPFISVNRSVWRKSGNVSSTPRRLTWPS